MYPSTWALYEILSCAFVYYYLHIAAFYHWLHRDVGGSSGRSVTTACQSGTPQHTATVTGERRAANRCSLRREAGRYREIAAADDGQHDLSKRAAAEAIDDEVHRWVCDDQQVADALVEEERTRAGLGVLTEEDDEQLSDESGCLTDNEDQHDNNQHPSDVVFWTAAVTHTIRLTALCSRRRPDTTFMTTLMMRTFITSEKRLTHFSKTGSTAAFCTM